MVSWGPTTLSLLGVSARVAQLVADRFCLPLPPEVAADTIGSAGAFWQWWAIQPLLPLVVAEEESYAVAALSIGLPAVAAGPEILELFAFDGELHPDMPAVLLRGRLVFVQSDHSDRSDPDKAKAIRAICLLAQLLQVRAGAIVPSDRPLTLKTLDQICKGSPSPELVMGAPGPAGGRASSERVGLP